MKAIIKHSTVKQQVIDLQSSKNKQQPFCFMLQLVFPEIVCNMLKMKKDKPYNLYRILPKRTINKSSQIKI